MHLYLFRLHVMIAAQGPRPPPAKDLCIFCFFPTCDALGPATSPSQARGGGRCQGRTPAAGQGHVLAHAFGDLFHVAWQQDQGPAQAKLGSAAPKTPPKRSAPAPPPHRSAARERLPAGDAAAKAAAPPPQRSAAKERLPAGDAAAKAAAPPPQRSAAKERSPAGNVAAKAAAPPPQRSAAKERSPAGDAAAKAAAPPPQRSAAKERSPAGNVAAKAAAPPPQRSAARERSPARDVAAKAAAGERPPRAVIPAALPARDGGTPSQCAFGRRRPGWDNLRFHERVAWMRRHRLPEGSVGQMLRRRLGLLCPETAR